ncbi:MAG TPA: (4Fe-4S)-binding protein [Lentisphaeria bacterium]|nr:MAG: (4Fe-4S)-binding protein [Lentisphaerae bacterium GWF2_49_21]HBC89802.1 (4Fe-4S)-binding protein [Lentisphaeria bacterium]
MKEIVVISGKGGTGKTTIAASFAALAENAVMADCDVDASDLHLILRPVIKTGNRFFCGHEAEIRKNDCISCGACLANCRFEAVKMNGDVAGEAEFSIDASACDGCGACVYLCPVKAIDFHSRYCGEWFVSDTRFGPMVHAVLAPGAENSGKLVNLVRMNAKKTAEETGGNIIITDGPPGIGCPVISSVTGADAVLAVAEPTLSGLHDLRRIMELARHFGIRTLVCVNRSDMNTGISEEIEKLSAESGAVFAGRIPYDDEINRAHDGGISIIEHGKGESVGRIREVWNETRRNI